MKERFLSLHLDFLGFSASMICAVHCGMLPVLLTLSATGAFAWMGNPWVEAGFIGLSMLFAIWALGRNFRKHYHIRMALSIVLAGFALIIGGHMLHGSWEYLLSAMGGVTIAAGHVINWKLARKSRCCDTH